MPALSHPGLAVDKSCPPGAVVQRNSGRTRLVSGNYWKLLVPKHLLHMPRLPGLMSEIMAEPAVRFDVVAGNALASKVLQNAQAVIRSLPTKRFFKIGLSLNPVHRWCNLEYGYQNSISPHWSQMRVLAMLEHGEAAGFVEAALVASWQADSRCLNSAHGGEAVAKQEGPFCVYVVVAQA